MLLALMVSAAVPIAPIETFGDWAVACDNVRVCEMVSLAPEDHDGPETDFSIRREPGPDGTLTVAIGAGHRRPTKVRISIDGKLVQSAVMDEKGICFTGADAQLFAAAMVKGKQFRVLDENQRRVAEASLAGSAAAFRYIDARQERAGTVTAVVALGTKPAASVPASPPTPVVSQVRPVGRAAEFAPALRARIGKESRCDTVAGADSGRSATLHALGADQTLVLIPCGAHPSYNERSVAYVLEDGRATLAAFDYLHDQQNGGLPSLINVEWDEAKGELITNNGGSLPGDCGSSESYVWDGTKFRLIEAFSMDECRGARKALRVWHAEARMR